MAATESSPVFVRVGSGLLVNIKYIMTIATKLRLAQNGTETELEGGDYANFIQWSNAGGSSTIF